MSKRSNPKNLLGTSVLAAIAAVIATSSLGVNSAMSQEAAVLSKEAEALKKAEFRKATSLKDLPSEVRSALGEIADVGKPFAAGCVGGPGVPHQRLICAFVSDNRCWVSYESGGFAYMRRVALFPCGSAADAKETKTLWSSITPEAIETIDALKKFVSDQISAKSN